MEGKKVGNSLSGEDLRATAMLLSIVIISI